MRRVDAAVDRTSGHKNAAGRTWSALPRPALPPLNCSGLRRSAIPTRRPSVFPTSVAPASGQYAESGGRITCQAVVRMMRTSSHSDQRET